ncbi:MAG TPA: M48 family metalloprotease [Vicinamibacteria bacterium]|nr:M48 family metalloprotease [Vicinamibacteria bacterium]
MRKGISFCLGASIVLLVGENAFGEKLRGYVWDLGASSLVVEGVPVRTTAETRIERPNHKGVTFADLRIGWEVEVDGTRGGDAFLAKKLKVKNKRFEEVDLEGFLEVRENARIELGGRELVWPQGAAPSEPLRSGMRIDGKGIVLDRGAVQVKEAKIYPPGFDEEETRFMSLVAQEVEKLKEELPRSDDAALQDYVARVGSGLVPRWVDTDELKFNFSVIEDPSLNAFALPDGTVVVHTGLLRVLENEAQLATVMGHEIAHATHRHGYRGYKQRNKLKWLQLGALAGGIVVGAKTDNPWAGLLTGLGSSLTLGAIVNGHGRDLEDEADRVGLEYMIDAGYDPFQAPEVWRIFNRHTGDQGAVANFFFSDHSTHQARISNLTREINSNYRGKLDTASLKTNEGAFERATAKLKAAPAKPSSR